MRAAIYVRVSDQSQVDGYSLSAQERLVLDYCKSRDWVPVRVYTEEGRSARYEAIRKRPVFQDLLTDITKGEIDTVVVHTLDRWARNLKVMLESLSMLGQHNVGFVSITENLDYSTSLRYASLSEESVSRCIGKTPPSLNLQRRRVRRYSY